MDAAKKSSLMPREYVARESDGGLQNQGCLVTPRYLDKGPSTRYPYNPPTIISQRTLLASQSFQKPESKQQSPHNSIPPHYLTQNVPLRLEKALGALDNRLPLHLPQRRHPLPRRRRVRRSGLLLYSRRLQSQPERQSRRSRRRRLAEPLQHLQRLREAQGQEHSQHTRS